MRCLSWLWMAAACGRIQFDSHSNATVDAETCRAAPSGHDEDVDTIDDSCDVCPHIADPEQRDGDGDGVGDACDPQPAQPSERIEMFDPFVTLGAPTGWTPRLFGGTVEVSADELVLAAGTNTVVYARELVPTRDSFVIAARAGAGPNTQHQFAIMLRDTATGSVIYCELYDSGSASALKVTYQLMGGAYVSPDADAMLARFGGASGTLAYAIDPSDARCSTRWGNENLAVAAMRPSGVAPDELYLYAEGLDMRVAYFVHIRTQ